jgi:hypothetical protein
MNPNARWDNIALHGNEPSYHSGALRTFAGNFLFSTGPNTQGGGKRNTQGHYDVPMRDCTVMLEAPRIRDAVDAMRAAVAEAIGIDTSRVSIKAKTNEGVDAVGRGEAIAAQAVALLRAR